MFCGTRSFSDLDDGSRRASSPRPKLSKLKQSLSLDRGKKRTSNPYSKEGLDKFEKLVAELEAKKEGVLLKKKKGGGSDQDSSTTIVRFKYNSDTGDWIPIVVRLQPAEAKKKKKADQSSKEKPIRAPPTSTEEVVKEVSIKQEVAVEEKRSSMYRWMNVQHFWAMRMIVVVVVVLVVLSCCCFLLIGRAFVVCSATILWYVVPITMNSEGISWDWKVYGKRLLMMITSTTDKWLPRNFNLGVAPSSSSSSSSSSMNVRKKGSDRVLLVSNPRNSTAK